MGLDYIKTESKKLTSMSFIVVGSFLLLEHIYTYGGIDLLDILGHEWIGILFILVGILIGNRWGRMKFSEVFTYAKEKLQYVFNKHL